MVAEKSPQLGSSHADRQSSSINLFICRVSRSTSNMLKLYRAPMAPPLSAAAFRNASRLGLSKTFSSNKGGQPMQGWVPTPYVTETIVCLLIPSDLAISKLT